MARARGAPCLAFGPGGGIARLLVLGSGLLERFERLGDGSLGICVREPVGDAFQARHAQLARKREAERLHHEAAHVGARVLEMRGEHVQRMDAAPRRERREDMGREAPAAEPRLDLRERGCVPRLGDDAIRRSLNDVLVGG